MTCNVHSDTARDRTSNPPPARRPLLPHTPHPPTPLLSHTAASVSLVLRATSCFPPRDCGVFVFKRCENGDWDLGAVRYSLGFEESNRLAQSHPGARCSAGYRTNVVFFLENRKSRDTRVRPPPEFNGIFATSLSKDYIFLLLMQHFNFYSAGAQPRLSCCMYRDAQIQPFVPEPHQSELRSSAVINLIGLHGPKTGHGSRTKRAEKKLRNAKRKNGENNNSRNKQSILFRKFALFSHSLQGTPNAWTCFIEEMRQLL